MLQPLESKAPPCFITSNWFFHQKLKLCSKEGILAFLYISYKWLIGAGEWSSLLPGWFFQRFVALSHFLPHKFFFSLYFGVLNIYVLVSKYTEHRVSLKQNYEAREICLQPCLSNSHLLQKKKCLTNFSHNCSIKTIPSICIHNSINSWWGQSDIISKVDAF